MDVPREMEGGNYLDQEVKESIATSLIAISIVAKKLAKEIISEETKGVNYVKDETTIRDHTDRKDTYTDA